jgi:methionyl-tRNA synthetase
MENITFEEFKKLELKVGEIRSAEEIVGADKLYKIKVDLGGEEREVVAGIKKFYSIESLIGKKIAVLANLEPRVIRGVTSFGMLLAASNEDKTDLSILMLDHDLPSGSKIS